MLFESWQTIKRKPIPPTTLQRQMPEPQPPTPKTPKVTKQTQRMATQTNSTKYATTENTETLRATYIRRWWSNHGCKQLNIISWATPDIHIMLKNITDFKISHAKTLVADITNKKVSVLRIEPYVVPQLQVMENTVAPTLTHTCDAVLHLNPMRANKH